MTAEEQASFNVDALVNEYEPDSIPNIPITPRGGQFEQPRRSTPTIPPGFTVPVMPRAVFDEAGSRPGSRPMSRTTSSTILPAVPVIPVTPSQAGTPTRAKKGKQAADVATIMEAPAKVAPQTPTKTATKTKSTTETPSREKDETPVQKGKKQKNDAKTAQGEAIPKETAKGKAASKKSANVELSPQKKPAKETREESKKENALIIPATPTKRPPPTKLDISVATKGPELESLQSTAQQKIDAQAKAARSGPIPAALSVPPSPAPTTTESPIKRTVAPRTLRVVSTPKTEVPPPLSASALPSLPQIPTVDKLRSRQASIASVNMPGTPTSDMISDTASITSASYSRANSPPPLVSRVGTAPVRAKTKSQAKKDRQERKRQIEDDLAADENKSDVEVVQAPIIGRKKKTKKPSTTPKPPVAAAKSQPTSPKPTTFEDEQSDVPSAPSKHEQSAKTSARGTPEPDNTAETKDKREHSAQSIMADLQRTGELLASTLEFFKPLSSSLTHASRTSAASGATGPPDLKIHFSEADLDALAKKKPVRLTGYEGKPDSRTLITPNGKFFWGLSEELEEKALQLEQQIEELKGHARFHPRKSSQSAYTHHDSQNQPQDVLPAIATALKEAGKKLGTANTQQMPKIDPSHGQEAQQPPAVQHQQTPGDAGAYLNQFVLPKTDNPPPNQPRPEMAAVGGPPGSGTANMSVNAGKFAKAAKAVVEGGAVGSTEIDGMGMMAADLLGGVFVQDLEALVGAGLGFQSAQEFGHDGNGNITLGGHNGAAFDVQGLMNAIESTSGMSGFTGYGGAANGRGRGSVMSMEEAERALHAARKEHDVLEKRLAGLIKKNRKLFMGTGRA